MLYLLYPSTLSMCWQLLYNIMESILWQLLRYLYLWSILYKYYSTKSCYQWSSKFQILKLMECFLKLTFIKTFKFWISMRIACIKKKVSWTYTRKRYLYSRHLPSFLWLYCSCLPFLELYMGFTIIIITSR